MKINTQIDLSGKLQLITFTALVSIICVAVPTAFLGATFQTETSKETYFCLAFGIFGVLFARFALLNTIELTIRELRTKSYLIKSNENSIIIDDGKTLKNFNKEDIQSVWIDEQLLNRHAIVIEAKKSFYFGIFMTKEEQLSTLHYLKEKLGKI